MEPENETFNLVAYASVFFLLTLNAIGIILVFFSDKFVENGFINDKDWKDSHDNSDDVE